MFRTCFTLSGYSIVRNKRVIFKVTVNLRFEGSKNLVVDKQHVDIIVWEVGPIVKLNFFLDTQIGKTKHNSV